MKNTTLIIVALIQIVIISGCSKKVISSSPEEALTNLITASKDQNTKVYKTCWSLEAVKKDPIIATMRYMAYIPTKISNLETKYISEEKAIIQFTAYDAMLGSMSGESEITKDSKAGWKVNSIMCTKQM